MRRPDVTNPGLALPAGATAGRMCLVPLAAAVYQIRKWVEQTLISKGRMVSTCRGASGTAQTAPH